MSRGSRSPENCPRARLYNPVGTTLSTTGDETRDVAQARDLVGGCDQKHRPERRPPTTPDDEPGPCLRVLDLECPSDTDRREEGDENVRGSLVDGVNY